MIYIAEYIFPGKIFDEERYGKMIFASNIKMMDTHVSVDYLDY